MLHGGDGVAGLQVTLEADAARRAVTDAHGRVHFVNLPAGTYRLSVEAVEQAVEIGDELTTLQLDLRAPSSVALGRFGRWEIDRAQLNRLPNAGTSSSLLETLDPFAVTHRIDVAGVESATEPLWSVRGSSWTQNQVLLDGLDVTDPAGGAPLLYPDIGFYEQLILDTSARSAEASGPGAELRFVTRTGEPAHRATVGFRASGRALQSDNRNERHLALGIEPRELRRYAKAHLELGTRRFYGAASGLAMATRVPKFEPEERFSVTGVLGKLTTGRLALLGLLQRVGRPTLGARPGYTRETTVDATESFQVFQGAVEEGPFALRLGFARGELTSSFEGGATPLRDLATEERSGAPPLLFERERMRFSAAGRAEFSRSSHLLRGGFELSYASESTSERVPGSLERLTVDGAPHAVSVFSGAVERRVGLSRFALFFQDAFFFRFLGRSWRLSPGVRFDDSRGGGIGWTSVSASVRGGVPMTPSSEVHFSAGLYPHTLTSGVHGVDETLTWTRHRWTDANEDGDVSPNEIGAILRRGGGDYTTLEDGLPRPVTYELTVGVEKRFRRGVLRFSGYQRWERRLLQTVNVGIDPSSYETFVFRDVGIDGVPGSADDADVPVHDQTAQFGDDRFLVTHPPGLSSLAQGVDLLLGFDHGHFSWRLSGRAYRDVGSGNPGNEATRNDTGVLGALYDDPNSLTNAEGRLFFDRAFTGKLALTARGPLGLRLGSAVRYWDGQPFARHLFFPELGQGFVRIQAFPRGQLRYAFNMTVDVRAERDFELGGARLGLTIDAFNLFNQSLHTAEVVRSGMEFRDPTFIQPGRTIVLEARLRF